MHSLDTHAPTRHTCTHSTHMHTLHRRAVLAPTAGVHVAVDLHLVRDLAPAQQIHLTLSPLQHGEVGHPGGGHAAPELLVQRFDADVRVAIGLDSSQEKPEACVRPRVCTCACVFVHVCLCVCVCMHLFACGCRGRVRVRRHACGGVVDRASTRGGRSWA